MNKFSFFAMVAVAGAMMANGANAFEMRRIAVEDNGSTVHRCIVSTNKLVQETVVSGVTTDVQSNLTTDVATITNLISQVPADFTDQSKEQNASQYVNWWVKNDGEKNFRLVRTSVADANGEFTPSQEPSQASQRLAVILGTICGF
jgi:hypothetical protein